MKLRRYNDMGHKILELTGPIKNSDEATLLPIFSVADFEYLIVRRIFVFSDTIICQLINLHLIHFNEIAPLHITVDEIYLCSYLNKLGLKVTYQRHDAIFSRLKDFSQTKIIALTGSTDSSDKIYTLLSHLPFRENVSICLVQHISKDAQLIQDSIIQDITCYRVQYAQHRMKIKGGNVYICQPDYHLRIKAGCFVLDKSAAVENARPSIDVILTSLADEYGASAIGIVFCGYGRDGIAGAGYAIDNNMPIIIEKIKECSVKQLLKGIKKAGFYHLEAPVLKIVELLSIMTSDEKNLLQDYLQSAFNLYGYDFRNYVLESIERRIDAAVSKYNYSSRRHFLVNTLSYKQKFKRLLMELSISTSYFFREPNSWSVIKDKIFPELNHYHHLKFWSAGASTGKEAYSLAILAEQENILEKCLIYATDLNKNSLKIAQNGLYSLAEIEGLYDNFKHSGCTSNINQYICKEETFFSISSRLRKQVFFFQHNLVTEKSMNAFHLILFNNVQIYFNSYLRDSVMELIKNSLVVGGYLVIGENENITGLQQQPYFKAITKNIYQKLP